VFGTPPCAVRSSSGNGSAAWTVTFTVTDPPRPPGPQRT
jgi:hypothetical protein